MGDMEEHIEENLKDIRVYIHDCIDCIFLGRGIHMGKSCDWYICPNKKNPSMSTVIARYSNEGSDYASYHWEQYARLAEDGFKQIPRFQPGIHELDFGDLVYDDDLPDDDNEDEYSAENGYDQSELPID